MSMFYQKPFRSALTRALLGVSLLLVLAACSINPGSVSTSLSTTNITANFNLAHRSAKITEFALPSATAAPVAITVGPDGNLWFTEDAGNAIGRITPRGAITEFPIPSANATANSITKGPDGNLWFTEFSSRKIGRITPHSVITEFPLPSSDTTGTPQSITAGPDGNLWFSELNGNNIGRITTSGVITEFSLPANNAVGTATITKGPDGNLWFTELFGKVVTVNPVGPVLGPPVQAYEGQIGFITPQGAITEFPVPTIDALPDGITKGPDGNLWFTEQAGNKIGCLTPAGFLTEFSLGPLTQQPARAGLGNITSGGDGTLWFTEAGGNALGRITTGGSITTFALPTPGADPGDLVSVNGTIWFTETGSGKIGELRFV